MLSRRLNARVSPGWLIRAVAGRDDSSRHDGGNL